MASNRNEVLIEGNLTKDPQLKTFGNGIGVCNFCIASNKWHKKGDVFEKETSFIDIVCFANLAQEANTNLVKGNLVEVRGRIKQERWNDKETGQPRSRIVVVANSVVPIQREPKGYETESKGW